MTTDLTVSTFTTPPPATTTSSAQAQLTTDYEMFLQMLTTQMEYQDPLNPIESSDYATQLATFSGVEQAVLTNDLLTSLTEQLTADGLADMASWVGKEARSTVPFEFDGTALTLPVEVAPGADAATLIVQNEDGQELQRVTIPLGSETVTWDGTGNDETTLPAGSYRFEVASQQQGATLSQTPVSDYRLVTEVRLTDGQTQLVFADGAVADTGDVTALREPT